MPSRAQKALASLARQLNKISEEDDEHAAMLEAGCAQHLALLLGDTQPLETRGVAARVCKTLVMPVASEAARDALVEAGALPPLLALLREDATSDAVEYAASALANLTCNAEPRKAAIFEAGAVPALVALLEAGAESNAAYRAAIALANLATSETRRAAIVEAGAVPRLVALLAARTGSLVARRAAMALNNLAFKSVARSAAIVEAGAVPGLVALLADGPDAKAARHAELALANLACSEPDRAARPHAALILTTAREQGRSLAAFETLQRRLKPAASARLAAAQQGTDRGALREAIEEAVLANDGELTDTIAAARARLDELAARRARRESVGLGSVQPPDEFTCPINYELMVDPVVASDGHSYERSAIQTWLDRGPNQKSPLTHEKLKRTLVPNHALRRRIEEHEAELDRMAEKVEGSVEAGKAAAEARASAEAARASAAEAEAAALREQLEQLRQANGKRAADGEAVDAPAAKRRSGRLRR